LELFSAASTPASKVNVVVLDLEAVAADIGPRELVEARVLQVEDVAAVQADEVMMLVEFGVEPGGRAGVTGLGKKAERDECPQNAMDRHPGDLGESDAHGPVKLLGRGVVAAVEDGFKHGPALGGDRQSALAMCGEEQVEPLLLFRWTHVSELEICTR
jgi:hypothetical protein